MEKEKPQSTRKLTPITLLQTVYLSIMFTSSNDLVSYAASCSFGFLMSFIPIVMMILVILIRFMRANTELVISALSFNPLITDFVNLQNLATSIQQIKRITNFEIILAVATIWVARKFFNSLMRSMRRIFKQTYRVQKGMLQLLTFTAEAILTILLSALIFILVSFRTIVRLPILSKLSTRYPELMTSFSNLLVTTVPFILLFVGAVIVYMFASRTKPTLLLCIISALGAVLSMWGFRKIMRLFININRYNTIYGVLSNAVVLLLQVYFFFLIFLFFAQFLFVNQFFDSLVLSELYDLPNRNDTKPKSTLRRLLFIRPDSLLLDKKNVMRLKKGDYIYRKGEWGTDSFYIVKGTVFIAHKNNLECLTKGMFFGEEAAMLDGMRTEDAIANTDIEIVHIPENIFFSLLERNPSIAHKSLSQISAYFSKFYGRNEDYSL